MTMNPHAQNDSFLVFCFSNFENGSKRHEATLNSRPRPSVELIWSQKTSKARCGSLWQVRCESSKLSKAVEIQPTDLCGSIDGCTVEFCGYICLMDLFYLIVFV